MAGFERGVGYILAEQKIRTWTPIFNVLAGVVFHWLKATRV